MKDSSRLLDPLSGPQSISTQKESFHVLSGSLSTLVIVYLGLFNGATVPVTDIAPSNDEEISRRYWWQHRFDKVRPVTLHTRQWEARSSLALR